MPTSCDPSPDDSLRAVRDRAQPQTGSNPRLWPSRNTAGRPSGCAALQQAGRQRVPLACLLPVRPYSRMSTRPIVHPASRSYEGTAGLQVIVLASRKGGAGKTTLCSHLSVQCERSGAGRVAIADTDPQGGLAAWFNARAAETPIFVDTSKGLAAAVKACRAGGINLLLVDTPPSVADIIGSVVREADLVIVPVRPSPNDLRAVAGTVELIAKVKKPMVFVVNQVTPRARITAEAAIALSQHGTVAPLMLASRVDFATSMTDGRTAGELDPSSRSAAEVAALWEYLAIRLKEAARV